MNLPEEYKQIVKKAIQKGKITKYEDWCKTEESEEYAFSKG